MAPANEKISLPGYGLNIGHGLDRQKNDWKFGHASLIDYANGVLVRERKLCQAMNLLTDKPDWRRKVLDVEICRRWRGEIVMEEGAGFSDRMFDFCLAELRDKAAVNTDTGIVRVLDDRFAVAKSDTIVAKDLQEALKKTVPRLLEAVPAAQKDWHPDSNEQVLDLVHPSLFPLVFGRSKILSNRTSTLDSCLRDLGEGETFEPDMTAKGIDKSLLSSKYQWLPTDFEFSPNGVRVKSYINNLHPVHHRDLYPLIERLVDAAVPVWSEVLSFTRQQRDEKQTRFTDRDPDYTMVEGTGAKELHAKWEREGMPEGVAARNQTIPSVDDIDPWEYPTEFGADWEWDFPYRTRILKQPEPREYAEYKKIVDDTVKSHQLQEEFAIEGLQVIVKLANIVLTPDKPEYAGGSWHVEGMLNEKICATALYYYDSENITDSHLAFRAEMDSEELIMRTPQNDYSGYETIFGVKNEENAVQDIGQVLTREGRMLAFPNLIQHCVTPFSLQDKTKPGHRKIIALFLVDPTRRIISTSHIPPQRKDWWAEEVLKTNVLGGVPVETAEQIIRDVDVFPISMEDAKGLRLELMEERKMRDRYEEQTRLENAFSFCEH
ncbi:hypothetical protein ANO11243_027430 [Dothideomycetidae sp. 11243]|nr:hypothetical protein ANO11243_027430 [fungal sp. No.11243]